MEVLNLMLSRCAGLDVDARNLLGFTPLMKAALQGRTKCAKLLLFAGKCSSEDPSPSPSKGRLFDCPNCTLVTLRIEAPDWVGSPLDISDRQKA